MIKISLKLSLARPDVFRSSQFSTQIRLLVQVVSIINCDVKSKKYKFVDEDEMFEVEYQRYSASFVLCYNSVENL